MPDRTTDDFGPFTEQIRGTIDGMGTAEFDALPVGAIQVDGSGVIHRYNRTESRLSGRIPERVIGRNFFTEVAPCTNIPAFSGRFMDGVTSGTLDARFDFVFDFQMAPVRVQIRMQNAGVPDRYWIFVRKLEDLRPPGPAPEAPAAHTASVTGEVVDFSVCEQEDIRRVGAIQPWGAVLAVDPRDWTVCAASDNAQALLDCARPPLGRPLGEVLDAGPLAALRDWLPDRTSRSWRGEMARGRRIDIRAHRSGGCVVLDLEPLTARPGEAPVCSLLAAVEADVAVIRQASSLTGLAQACARSVRVLTGFERAIVYRFDADWHGEVIAEDKVEDWPQSFAGLHFPASDIPRQARELYSQSLSRHVPDRDYVPVPVHRIEGTEPLDLSFSRHRSLSPVHLQYLRNMGVTASMSFSILVEGRLWGMVAAHHRQPHHVAIPRRSAAMTVVEAVALSIAAVERAEAMRGRQVDHAVLTALMVQMASSDAVEPALTQQATRLTDLFGATGAALSIDGHLLTVGDCPPPAEVAALRAWLEPRWGSAGLFRTSSLSSVFPDATAYRQKASGLLALRLSGGDFVMWTRPEEPRQITWGGDPAKPLGAAGQRPMPRISFDRWVEERRGHAAPWPTWADEIATSLRHAISDMMLRHLRHVKELSDQLAASNEAKSRFLANMSHELRTPLNAIIGFSDLMMSGMAGTLPPRIQDYVQSIHASGEHLLRMVNDVLDLSRIEAGRMELSPESLDAGILAAECVGMLLPRAVRGEVLLEVQAESPLPLTADALRLRQILLNIIGNAVKFTPPGGRVDVRARALAGGGAVFTVRDTGPGMTPEEVLTAMEPFRQVAQTRAAVEGTGLGLPIAKSLVDLHAGNLAIETAPGLGTTVTIEIGA
ncbi:photoactive yellow protein [Rhodospirillum centenum]|uniref:Photoactive yellow protein n=1 Tax=Rhodospirillum centenum (strain ATCC 51521 / SW) TaxID=414684 RepID=B6IWB2_RHOCS|nr:photoactive yellow protein [Rhodospirillum centenum]ACJ00586.1 bacteriophytochrome Ppr (contains PYP domain) [Rhodospirillum centenum SW]